MSQTLVQMQIFYEIASGLVKTNAVKETQRLGAGRFVNKRHTLDTIGLTVKAKLSQLYGTMGQAFQTPGRGDFDKVQFTLQFPDRRCAAVGQSRS